MAIAPEDHERARNLRQELQAKTSFNGHGHKPISDFEQQFQSVIRSHNPSATVIWMAGSMQTRHFDSDWSRATVVALEDLFRIKLNGDLIQTQIDLADSNDRLGRKMLWATVVGVVVAGVGVVVALVPMFGH